MEAFFLPTAEGSRFCVFHPAHGQTRANILFVPPFAEEMNKSRRMVALQARAFAQIGYSVLLIDLAGTGDSSGDFGDASWELWQKDLAFAAAWLNDREPAPLFVWALRLGALLALDSSAKSYIAPQRFLLWQPVVSGETFLTQFLRLRLAGDMLSGAQSTGGVQALRAELQVGTSLEIAGYEISPALGEAIDKLRLLTLRPASTPVHWQELVAESGRTLPPAAQRVADSWRAEDVHLTLETIACEPFWTTQEITECSALIKATSAVWAE